MTPLRAKYIRDLTIRGRARRTQRAYTRYVSELARYYQRSPELISYEEVTNWLYHLIKELVDYWRAQRQAKAGHDSPWLFLGKRAGEPVSLSSAQNIYNRAVEKSGVQRKGGIHVLRHYP